MDRSCCQDGQHQAHAHQEQVGFTHGLVCQGQDILSGSSDNNHSVNILFIGRVIYGYGLGQILHILVIMAAVLSFKALDDFL